jgi:hypothetical protein
MISCFWITAEISIGKGIFWEIIKDFPIIKSTHVNVRYCGSIILFLTILTSFCHYQLANQASCKKRSIFFHSATWISIISMLSYFFIIERKTAFTAYDHSFEKKIWSDIQGGNRMIPIKHIIDTDPKDHLSHFHKNASCYLPHDPLYGYHGHYFLPATEPGITNRINEKGFFNFHDPRSFYLQSEKDTNRKLIHSSDKLNFNLFMNRKQPKWDFPVLQKVGNHSTAISLFLFLTYMLFLSIQKIRRLY